MQWANDQLRKFPYPPTDEEKRRVQTLMRYTFKNGSLLDVGCGSGSFALEAKRQGFSVSVLDIVNPILKQLRAKGITIFGSFRGLHGKRFSCVTCFDVIEHTTKPGVFMNDLSNAMRSNGFLFITTPNAASLSARILGKHWWVFGPEGHYVLFTPTSLSRMVRRHGFVIDHMETNTLTQWFQPGNTGMNRVWNKFVYCALFVLLPLLYRYGLGDNIEILARKQA